MKRIIEAALTLLLTTALLGGGMQAALAQGAAKKPAHKTTPPTKTKKVASVVKYRAHCGMIYSAADAKKYHYVCPMDHKPLVKITSAAPLNKKNKHK